MEDLRNVLMNMPNEPVSRLVRAFALPKEFSDGVRMASEGSGIKTATANLTSQYPTTTWSNAVASTRIPATDMLFFLFNNILRSCVFFDHNPSAAVMTYGAQFSQGGATQACPLLTRTKLQPRLFTPSTAYRPHGDLLFCGVDEAGDIYVPVDQGNSLFVTLAPAPTTTAGLVEFFLWDGKKGILVNTQPFVAGQVNYPYTVPVSGEYYAAVVNSDTSDKTAAYAINGFSPVWCHRPVSNVSTLLTQAGGVRVNFASTKTSNTANDQDKNGNLGSVTMSSAIPWRQYATGYQAFTELEGFVSRLAMKGNYVFNVPDSDNDIDEFYDDIAFGGFAGAISQVTYPLSERQPYKAVALTVPSAAGRAFTFEVTHAIEYLTNVQLVERDISSFSPSQVSAAVQILRTMATDYDNDTHIGDILATIGKYLPRGAASLGKLLKVFSGGNPRVNAVSDWLQDESIQQFGDSLRTFKKKKK